MAHAGGGKDLEQGTHKCEMNSQEGNGKPLLESNSCLENPLLDLQESEQTQRTTTTTTTTTMYFYNRMHVKYHQYTVEIIASNIQELNM